MKTRFVLRRLLDFEATLMFHCLMLSGSRTGPQLADMLPLAVGSALGSQSRQEFMSADTRLQLEWILAHCGPNASAHRRWYSEYCEAAVRGGLKNPAPETVLQQVVLGGREFLQGLLRESDQTPARPRPGFEQIRIAVEKVREQPLEMMVNRHGDGSRDLALYLMRENGHRLPAAAAPVGLKRAPTAGTAIQRFEQRLATDKTLRKTVAQVRKALS